MIILELIVAGIVVSFLLPIVSFLFLGVMTILEGVVKTFTGMRD